MELQRDFVLLITHSGDYFTVDRVAAALSKRGVQPFRLDTDRFPLEMQIQGYLCNNGSEHQLKYRNISINTNQILGVWLRRIWQPQLGEELAPQFKASCIRESIAALDGFWDSLRTARWIDDVESIKAAENKLHQLRVACEVGLTIPQTLVTNNPEQVREFFYQLKGKMVTKLLTPLSYSMEGSSFFLYTSAVKEEDLTDLETLRYCPMVFQEQIPKQQELRVIFVDGNIFVGALDASKYEAFSVDWRRGTSEACVWKPHKLPQSITQRLNAFMAKFNLVFGAFDFIQTPSGEYVFLEVNPTGEWGMLERDLELPISEAIADALIVTRKS